MEKHDFRWGKGDPGRGTKRHSGVRRILARNIKKRKLGGHINRRIEITANVLLEDLRQVDRKAYAIIECQFSVHLPVVLCVPFQGLINRVIIDTPVDFLVALEISEQGIGERILAVEGIVSGHTEIKRSRETSPGIS